MPELSAYDVLRIVLAGSAIASIIGSTEWLYLRRHFRDWELYSWKVQLLSAGRLRRAAGPLIAYPQVQVLLIIQILLSILLLVPGLSGRAVGLCALGVAFCYFLLSLRGIDGFNGGDAMAKVVTLACGTAFLSGADLVLSGALFLITGHLLIAYSTPGWLRLFDPRWHDASKMLGVMRTESFGRPAVWRLLTGRPRFARVVASSIALWEAGFFLYLFLPLPLLCVMLAIGIVFHCTNAVVMGLNVFPWSFLGGYPAVIWTSLFIQSHLY
jgi:hypothetical protein